MKILFLHGFGSQPGGIKPAFLRGLGHEVINPALPDDDFDESVCIARQAVDRQRPDLVIGSSRGSAVALKLDAGLPAVLLAPAWKHWTPTATIDANTVILHSENDDVVAVENSRELVRRSRLPEDHLVVVGEDHKMIDEEAFEALRQAIERVGESL